MTDDKPFKIIYPECATCPSVEICDRYLELIGTQFCPKHIKTARQTKLF